MSLNIVIPKFTESESLPNWMERGLRQGNFLHRILEREKAMTGKRMTHVAQGYRNFEQKLKSEFELLSVMDGRTFLRWAIAEPGIVEDKNEFKKLVKDNPVMTPWRT